MNNKEAREALIRHVETMLADWEESGRTYGDFAAELVDFTTHKLQSELRVGKLRKAEKRPRESGHKNE